MIVTCPACSVRYLVDPRALGAKGRTVRCARCAHTWHQAPPPGEAPAPPEPPPPPPVARAPVLTSGESIRLPAVARPRRDWGAAAVWASVAVALVALLWAAAAQRGRIADWWPPAARIFAMAGLPVADAGLGLELRKVTPSRDIENGLPALVIDGEVANVSTLAHAVPKLKVILRDSGDHDLQDFTFAAPAETLLPGQSVPFHTSIAQPAEAATDVVVTFAGAGG